MILIIRTKSCIIYNFTGINYYCYLKYINFISCGVNYITVDGIGFNENNNMKYVTYTWS